MILKIPLFTIKRSCFIIALQLLFLQSVFAKESTNGMPYLSHTSTETLFQELILAGTITDENNEPVPGATIKVEGTSIGTTSSIDGTYTLSLPNDALNLVVSFIGFKKQIIPINNRTSINVLLEDDITELEDVVVVGYGSSVKANVTNAIATIKSQSFEDIPVSSIEQGIASQLAGVNISQSAGGPGQTSTIRIRGLSTVTAGSSPLIVLDGLPLSEETSLNSINPDDIESVDVLKDAASSAIYGSRGANGVILITTKKGKKGAPKFSFNAYTGTQQVAHKLNLMNAHEHAIFDRDARNNYYLGFDDGSFSASDDNATRQANAESLGFNGGKASIPTYAQPYLDGQSGLTDTDWQDEVFRKAKIQNYQISASGGNEKTSYLVSAGYFGQEGIIKNTKFDRFSFRSNIETKLSNRLKLGLNLAPSFINEDFLEGGFSASPINNIIMALPYFPARNTDGSLAVGNQVKAAGEFGQARAENPLAMVLLKTFERSKRQLLGSTYLELEIIEGLTAKTLLGIDLGNSRTQTFDPSTVGRRKVTAPDAPSGSASSFERLNWVSENTINYQTDFGYADHQLDVLVGYTFQKEQFHSSSLSATNFPNDRVLTLNAGTVDNGQTFSSEWALASYLGRVKYNYKGKYLFAATFRRDGSSRFGSNTRWGGFPSISVGYRIGDEEFLNQVDFLSNLKVRASWGVNGNNQIGDFASQALIGSSNAVLGGVTQVGLSPISSPNANLSWEQTNTIDVGLDIGFLEDKLTLTLDYYSAITEDMLLEVPVPAHSGFSNSLQNIGKMSNKGIEVALTGKFNLGPVKVVSNFNIASNNNKVLELGPGQDEILSGRSITRKGGEIGAEYGYRTLGIFTSDQQLDATPHLSNAAIGDYIYADSNGDGTIDTDDRVVLGSIHPDYTWGFNGNFSFKGIGLGFVLQGVQGVTITDNTINTLLYNPEGWSNGARDYLDNYYTTERGGSALYARPNVAPTDNGFYRNSDITRDDASFVRIRNITLSYTLPIEVISSIGITKLRLYLSSKNPFTFTDYRGYNPEQSSGNPLNPATGYDNYPIDKAFTLGLNLTF